MRDDKSMGRRHSGEEPRCRAGRPRLTLRLERLAAPQQSVAAKRDNRAGTQVPARLQVG